MGWFRWLSESGFEGHPPPMFLCKVFMTLDLGVDSEAWEGWFWCKVLIPKG
jgi:hypothetical protein